MPEKATPAGYAALIDAFGLRVPPPLSLCAIGPRHKLYEKDGWRIFTPRHAPAPTLEGHLIFALKYEGLDLAVLKKLFQTLPPGSLEVIVRAKPASAYLRRIWFLYEWLLDIRLDLEDVQSGNYVEIVDPDQQFAVVGKPFRRHRIRNNLPGSPSFCPLVRRTAVLNQFIEARLDERAAAIVREIPGSIMARTAAFLLLADSKSSFAIEGETPLQNRIQRWGKVIGEAGKYPLDGDELLRLQRIVIGDERFVRLGFRDEGGFVGQHEPGTRLPLPAHISARYQDLPDLIRGLVDFDASHAAHLPPVIAAAVLAFGFVYIHPFADGNGRLHRYLIHHTLSAGGFNPPGLVFPVSASILNRLEDYRRVLETRSERILPLIEWEPTERMNVRVLNETADLYSYCDLTPQAEFLFECVEQTIENDLPKEAEFLKRYDMFKSAIEAKIEMPASMIDLLFSFLKQNGGTLSKRARQREFEKLTGGEVQMAEEVYRSTVEAP